MPSPSRSRDVPGGGGREERDGNLNFPHRVRRPGRSGCNMTWARGQSIWAKVTSPPANGVSAGLPRLGVGNTPAIPTRAPGQSLKGRSVSSGSQKGRRRRRGRGIFAQRKDQGRPIPLSPLRFSVDNLSWPLRSWELCSRALGQNPGSRPPLGHRRGAGAGRGPRSLRGAEQGSQAGLGSQPRAAAGVG